MIYMHRGKPNMASMAGYTSHCRRLACQKSFIFIIIFFPSNKIA